MNQTLLNLTSILHGSGRFLNNQIPPEKRSTQGSPIVAFAVAASIFIIPFVAMYLEYKWKERKKTLLDQKAASTGAITDKIPDMVQGLETSVRYNDDLRFECVPYISKYNNNRILDGEKRQEAIEMIQDLYTNTRIPKTARIISVPMFNFETGRSCTEFIPITGMAPGAFLSYQICGDFKFQVTRYVENGVAYVAGYCMYIQDPYEDFTLFDLNHISNCHKATPEYELKEPKVDKKELIKTLKKLKLKFCKEIEEPVLIGLDNGVVKHFIWNNMTKSFEFGYCVQCQEEGLEENEEPPSYQSVISS